MDKSYLNMLRRDKSYDKCFDYDVTNVYEMISMSLLIALCLALLIYIFYNIAKIKLWIAQYPLSNPNKLYCTNSCLVLLISCNITPYSVFLSFYISFTIRKFLDLFQVRQKN